MPRLKIKGAYVISSHAQQEIEIQKYRGETLTKRLMIHDHLICIDKAAQGFESYFVRLYFLY